jgi:hypothetical protein
MLTLFSYLYRIVYIWVGKGSKREEQRCRWLGKTWHKIIEMYSLFIVDIVGPFGLFTVQKHKKLPLPCKTWILALKSVAILFQSSLIHTSHTVAPQFFAKCPHQCPLSDIAIPTTISCVFYLTSSLQARLLLKANKESETSKMPIDAVEPQSTLIGIIRHDRQGSDITSSCLPKSHSVSWWYERTSIQHC